MLFNDALNTFYLRLYGVRHMVKFHTNSERGNLLPPHGLLFPISSKGSFICTYHSLCYTSRGALARTRNRSMGPPHEGSIQWPIAPWANAPTTKLHHAPKPVEDREHFRQPVWPKITHTTWTLTDEREREMFCLTTHSTHFIYSYMASDIWLRTILIVRKETRCCHIGYSYRLTASVLLYAPSHRQDNTYHGLCYTSRGALAGTWNSSMGPSHEGSIWWPIAPWANALPLSYFPLLSLMMPNTIVLCFVTTAAETQFMRTQWMYRQSNVYRSIHAQRWNRLPITTWKMLNYVHLQTYSTSLS